MDEPASALDPLSTARIEDLIAELRKNYTIVIVTHNMQQAARVSDHTAFFFDGRLIEFDERPVIHEAKTEEDGRLYNRTIRLGRKETYMPSIWSRDRAPEEDDSWARRRRRGNGAPGGQIHRKFETSNWRRRLDADLKSTTSRSTSKRTATRSSRCTNRSPMTSASSSPR